MTLTADRLDGQAPETRPPRWRRAAARARVIGAQTWAAAAGWRWAPALPGAAGILACSAAAAGLVAWAVAWPPGLWAGTGVLGVFLLRIDHRAG